MTPLGLTILGLLLAWQSSEAPEVKYNVGFIAAVATVTSALISALGVFINSRMSRRNQSALQKEQADLNRVNQENLTNLQATLTLQTQRELEKAKSVLAEQSQTRLESHKADLAAKNQLGMEQLRATLGEQGKERDARRDYEYEAHKRLYAECEPLLFQLAELAEGAYHRVYSLARSARLGQIPKWLATDGYYRRSTMYKLMVPLVVFRLIQQRLTLVDLTLDEYIANQYRLLKLLYLTFTDPYYLAETFQAINYKPEERGASTKRLDNPAVYWQQGLYLGTLDNSIDALIVTDPQGKSRWKTFGEFDAELSDTESDTFIKFQPFAEVLEGFHPHQRPVFWRMLWVQTFIHTQIIQSQVTSKEISNRVGLAAISPNLPKRSLDWRKDQDEASDEEALDVPKEVARNYLALRLPDVFGANSKAFDN